MARFSAALIALRPLHRGASSQLFSAPRRSFSPRGKLRARVAGALGTVNASHQWIFSGLTLRCCVRRARNVSVALASKKSE
jgi:hypothetical protein